jgi:hypothetical protein
MRDGGGAESAQTRPVAVLPCEHPESQILRDGWLAPDKRASRKYFGSERQSVALTSPKPTSRKSAMLLALRDMEETSLLHANISSRGLIDSPYELLGLLGDLPLRGLQQRVSATQCRPPEFGRRVAPKPLSSTVLWRLLALPIYRQRACSRRRR